MKTRTIIATLIDPKARVVKPWALHTDEEGSAYDSLVDAISQYADSRLYIEHIDVGAGHGMYLDENGVLMPWDDQSFFKLGDQTFAGVAVIVRDTDDGYSASCEIPLGLIASRVEWIEPRQVRIPAPVMQTIGADGKVETTYLAGCREWTYDNQPA